jgi:hypothetical protein
MSTAQEDYIDSLDRLLGILRGQIDLARAVGVTRVAVDIEDLERLLNILEGDGPAPEQ